MKREFVVVDENGNISYGTKADAPEKFRSFAAAKTRAEELALCAPGETIKVYELTAESLCMVAPAETKRKHMREHYYD